MSISDLIEKPISGEWGSEVDQKVSGVPVIRNTNFTLEGRIDLQDVAYRSIPKKKVEQKKLKYGDIIIEKSGGSENQPVGRVVFFDIIDGNNYLFSNFTSSLRPNKNVCSKYIHYGLLNSYLKGYSELFQNKTTGIRNLQLDRYLHKIKIPLPSLEEQKAIVAKLDRAQRLIDIDKEMLAKYDELIQSVFLDMFGDPVTNPRKWEVKKLGDFIQIEKASFDPTVFRGKVKYVGLENIEKETGKFCDVGYIVEGDLKSNKFKFDKGHILYGKLRPYLNKTAFPNFDGVCSTDILPIKPINKIATKYFVGYLLKTRGFVNYADRKSSGANLPRISPKMIEKFPCYLPSVDQQLKFSDFVNHVEEQKNETLIMIKKSQDLFSSLIQKTFE